MSEVDLWYASRATGIVALVLLSATVFLGALVAGRARSSSPLFARAEVHRMVSLIALVFLAAHILTAVFDTYVHIGWWAVVVPFASSYKRRWVAIGTVGLDSLLAVAISSALRHRIPARAWRLVHWLAYLSWPAAVVHGLEMGSDTSFGWAQGVVAACTALVVGAVAWRSVEAVRARSARPLTIIGARPSLRLAARRQAGK